MLKDKELSNFVVIYLICGSDIWFKLVKIFTHRDHGTEVRSFRKISKNREHNQSGEHRGEGVTDADYEGVPGAVVVELVVTGERQLATVTNREREKYLRCSGAPNLGTSNKIFR